MNNKRTSGLYFRSSRDHNDLHPKLMNVYHSMLQYDGKTNNHRNTKKIAAHEWFYVYLVFIVYNILWNSY